MKDGLQKLCCAHRRLSPPDQHGYALCLDCAAAVPVMLTAYLLDKQFLSVIRPS